eukprot:3035190-Pleurochrysis_carterae.AAC.4
MRSDVTPRAAAAIEGGVCSTISHLHSPKPLATRLWDRLARSVATPSPSTPEEGDRSASASSSKPLLPELLLKLGSLLILSPQVPFALVGEPDSASCVRFSPIRCTEKTSRCGSLTELPMTSAKLTWIGADSALTTRHEEKAVTLILVCSPGATTMGISVLRRGLRAVVSRTMSVSGPTLASTRSISRALLTGALSHSHESVSTCAASDRAELRRDSATSLVAPPACARFGASGPELPPPPSADAEPASAGATATCGEKCACGTALPSASTAHTSTGPCSTPHANCCRPSERTHSAAASPARTCTLKGLPQMGWPLRATRSA